MEKMFSIIIPIYKAEKTLKRCVNSILNQEFKDYEIVLINDGSPDNCLKICKEYKENNNNIIIINKKNEGVSKARNEGIKISKGKYLVFVDSDDYIQPDMLAKLYYIITKKEYDVIYFGMNNVNQEGDIISSTHLKELSYSKEELYQGVEYLIKHNYMGFVGSKIIKREVIKKNKIKFDEKMNYSEDFMMSCDFFDKIQSLYISPFNLYNYVKYSEIGSSLSTRYIEDLIPIIDKLFINLKKVLENVCDNEKYKKNILLQFCIDQIPIIIINNIYTEKRMKFQDINLESKKFISSKVFNYLIENYKDIRVIKNVKNKVLLDKIIRYRSYRLLTIVILVYKSKKNLMIFYENKIRHNTE